LLATWRTQDLGRRGPRPRPGCGDPERDRRELLAGGDGSRPDQEDRLAGSTGGRSPRRPREDPRGRPHDARPGALRDGAGRARPPPRRRLRDQGAQRRLPAPRLRLRRDPPPDGHDGHADQLPRGRRDARRLTRRTTAVPVPLVRVCAPRGTGVRPPLVQRAVTPAASGMESWRQRSNRWAVALGWRWLRTTGHSLQGEERWRTALDRCVTRTPTTASSAWARLRVHPARN